MEPVEIERVFSMAISRELEANRFYSQVAKKTSIPAVKEIFEQLAREEMGHYELLERYHMDPTIAMKIGAPSLDWKLAESQELPAFSIDMKPADAIALAMKKEQQAVEFYRGLANACTDAPQKDIFNNLANMELGHKHRLESTFVDIGYPESF